MNRYTYPQVVLLLIIRVYAAVDTERGIRTRVQFRIEPGIFGDREQVQGLGINPYMVKMKVFDAFGGDSIPDRQVSAPEERTAFHGVGVEDSRVAEVRALFQQRRARAGVGDMSCRIQPVRRRARGVDQRRRMQGYLCAHLVAECLREVR